MRAAKTLFLLSLLPYLGACNLDFQLGDLKDTNPGSSDNTPDGGSCEGAPVLALVGPATQTQECGNPYSDPGATATDASFGDLSSSITRTGTVNTSAPGSYPLTYNVTNSAGQSAPPVTRTVNVNDSLPPALTLNGPSSASLECGGAYTDPGATANDACAGNLPVVASGSLDPRVPGNYTFSYSATDPSGNVGVSTSRTVTVSDTLAPTLTVLGPLNQTYECGSAYVDPGATATDACAGDLTSAIQATRTGSPNTPGSFTITYSVTDPGGNSVTSPQQRTVVVGDNTPPTLTLLGPAVQSAECAFPYADPGATATDACFGDVTSRIVRTGTVNTSVLASYSLTYNVTDPAGHSAPPVTRTVNVNDSLLPVVTLSGPDTINVECGSTYVDPGATAIDACAGSLPVSTPPPPDTRQPGTYSFSYSAMDPSGNVGVSRSRTVSVIDTMPPTLTINGPLNVTLECGTPYVDPGATAIDACAGSLPVIATSTGSPNRPGTFNVTYSAVDPAGNMIVSPIRRTVTVVDTLAPDIQVLPGPSDIQCNGTPYVDPGATANDTCEGDLTQAITVSSNLDQSRAGQYEISYRVTDTQGNTGVATRPITVGPCSLCLNLPPGDETLSLLEAPRGALAEKETVAARFAELRDLSYRLARLPTRGSTALESRETLSLRGTDPRLNVFELDSSVFTGARRLSIDAPAGSLVVVNILGESASFTRLEPMFSGGIDPHGVLYNFVEATELHADDSHFRGTLLAPYAHVDFNHGGWEGSLYAVSFTGDAEGHLSPLAIDELCP